jgi:hypothetical protein
MPKIKPNYPNQNIRNERHSEQPPGDFPQPPAHSRPDAGALPDEILPNSKILISLAGPVISA